VTEDGGSHPFDTSSFGGQSALLQGGSESPGMENFLSSPSHNSKYLIIFSLLPYLMNGGTKGYCCNHILSTSLVYVKDLLYELSPCLTFGLQSTKVAFDNYKTHRLSPSLRSTIKSFISFTYKKVEVINDSVLIQYGSTCSMCFASHSGRRERLLLSPSKKPRGGYG
jgi:hypothetical protein